MDVLTNLWSFPSIYVQQITTSGILSLQKCICQLYINEAKEEKQTADMGQNYIIQPMSKTLAVRQTLAERHISSLCVHKKVSSMVTGMEKTLLLWMSKWMNKYKPESVFS